MPLTVNPSQLSISGPPSDGREGDLGGEGDDVDMGDTTDATVGNTHVGGLVGDAGVDATDGNTNGGGLVGDAEGDATSQVGGIVRDARDMPVDEDHCDPAQDNDQETEASGSGSIKMDIAPENSKKPGSHNHPVTRSRKRPRRSTRSATDGDEDDESNSGTSQNPIDVDLYMSLWEHRISKDFVSISIVFF